MALCWFLPGFDNSLVCLVCFDLTDALLGMRRPSAGSLFWRWGWGGGMSGWLDIQGVCLRAR